MEMVGLAKPYCLERDDCGNRNWGTIMETLRASLVMAMLLLVACDEKAVGPADTGAEVAATDVGGPGELDTSQDPDYPQPTGQVEVLWLVDGLAPSLSPDEIHFALIWASQDVPPIASPAVAYEEGQPTSLVVDMAKHFASLEGSIIGDLGMGVGALMAFRDDNQDGSLDFEEDLPLAIVQSHIFVYIGSKKTCPWEEDPDFAPWLNFDCVPGIYAAQVMKVSKCSEDYGDCSCEDHDGAKKLNSQPLTLDVQVDLSKDFPCSSHLNFF